jgi:hypothetical protein
MKNIIVLTVDLDTNFYVMKIINSVKLLYPDCTGLKIIDMGRLPFIIDEFRFIFNSDLDLNMDEFELADIFIVVFGNTFAFPKGLQFRKCANPLSGLGPKISLGKPVVVLSFAADSIWSFLGVDPLLTNGVTPPDKIGRSRGTKKIVSPGSTGCGENSTMGRFWEILFTWAKRVDAHEEERSISSGSHL